ncbi:MAG: class I SAM-dependent methyltransferase [Candidatus Nanopelagicales bacterium]|nr:class I SAM-dependent methyltransferase [Candidatus Nanopelagicales bacterium]
MSDDRRQHWEQVHGTKPVDGVSWWQEPDDVWLDLVEDLGLANGARVADVGCGASMLVDALVDAGRYRVVGVDIAESAIERVRDRVGEHPALRLVAADVRTLRLPEPVDAWHDRAVFHFLVSEADRAAYRDSLAACLGPGGHAVVATFAADGPESCSGLPVQRYDGEALVAALGFAPADAVRIERRVHRTPWGSEQPFTVVVVRRPSS